jgi:hypothetical protein
MKWFTVGKYVIPLKKRCGAFLPGFPEPTFRERLTGFKKVRQAF